jgi:hypothetical protein
MSKTLYNYTQLKMRWNDEKERTASTTEKSHSRLCH